MSDSASTLDVETFLNIAKPRAEVFEAIVNPDHMAHYFITSGTGRLDGGEPVGWYWEDHGGATLLATPREIVPPERIVFAWEATGIETTVTIELSELSENENGETIVKVCEAGTPRNDEGIARALEQMQGWMHMLCCLKAYLEFGINLRAGKVVARETE